MERSLAGKEVCFTGRLASMTRSEAEERTKRAGGRPVSAPAASTSYLVVGGDFFSGNYVTRNFSTFKDLKEKGAPIECVGETEFLRMLDVKDKLLDFSKLYTMMQISRIAEIPITVVRSWIRHGLLKPSRVANKLPWFEYGDILAAKRLSKLSAAGVSVFELKRSLVEISRWFPDAERVVERLSAAERGLCLRLADGGWVDPTGQHLLNFNKAKEGTVSDFPRIENAWFFKAADAEERGELEQAAIAYKRALEESPDPVTYFNLGNVLFEQGHEGEAAECYLSALSIDGNFIESWNNLGNSLAALGKAEEALHAYQRALTLEPEYTDAHCNIAVVLEKLGRNEEAAFHRAICSRAYPPQSQLKILNRDENEC